MEVLKVIKLREGQITDLLPKKIADDVETKCLSYAIQREHQRIMSLVDRTRTLTVVDELPENLLDVLAVELRTPYYKESMELSVKRNVIKRTLSWHTKAGTPNAVSELIEMVFGKGSMVEWFDYTEPPYTPGTFDIITNAQLTVDIVDYFLPIIKRVKNTRSHIRRILTDRDMASVWYAALGSTCSPKYVIGNARVISGTIRMAAAQTSCGKTIIFCE